ncbi:MAG: GNAT family N-acetyltransferase [Solirubrobacteraceae bacterium]
MANGPGSRLCNVCRDWARQSGAHELVLTVLRSNDAALHVYETACLE